MTRIQLRRGTTAQWATANPILAAGEPGVDLDTAFFKIGDGVNTWATLPPVTDSLGINVDNYGAVGDGVTDDTTVIQAVLTAAPTGATVLLGAGKNYLVAGLTVTNKTDFTFDGNNSTLTLKATGARIAGVYVSGTSSNVTVRNVHVVGNGVLADAHAGVIIPSGSTISNLRILNNTIYNTTLGISLNADGSGSIRGALVQGNHVNTVIGTTSGYGYGIHHASSEDAVAQNVKIIGNTIELVQRHSIYQAKGTGITIADNTISRHREGVANGSFLSAIMMARSGDVTVTGNTISQFYDSAMTVGGIISATISRNYTVSGNVFAQPQDDVPCLVVGQGAGSEGYPTGVSITGNVFNITSGANAIRIQTGKHVAVTGNTVVNSNAGTVTGIRVLAIDDDAGTATYTDDLLFSNNVVALTGAGTRYAFGLLGAPETSIINMSFVGNKITATYAFLTTTDTVTNPNIYVSNQQANGASFSGTTTFSLGSRTSTGTTTTLWSTALALPAPSSQLILGDGATNASSQVLFQKADANHQTYAVMRVGTASSGNRWLLQHDNAEWLNFIRCNTSGSVLDTPLALEYQSGTAAGRSYAKVTRLAGNGGTALANTDWALSAGFGSTASVAVGTGSTDMRGSIVITSAGTGQGASPTATLTFKDGTFTTVPFVNVTRGGGSQRTVPFDVAPTATTLVLTFLGTPVAAETYTVHYMVVR